MEHDQQQFMHSAKKRPRKYSGWTQTSTQPASSFVKSSKASFFGRPMLSQKTNEDYNVHYSKNTTNNRLGDIEHCFQVAVSGDQESLNGSDSLKAASMELKAYSTSSRKPIEEKVLKIKGSNLLKFLNSFCSNLSSKSKDKFVFEGYRNRDIKNIFEKLDPNDCEYIDTGMPAETDSDTDHAGGDLTAEINSLKNEMAQLKLENEGLKKDKELWHANLQAQSQLLKKEKSDIQQKELRVTEIFFMIKNSLKDFKNIILNLESTIMSVQEPSSVNGNLENPSQVKSLPFDQRNQSFDSYETLDVNGNSSSSEENDLLKIESECYRLHQELYKLVSSNDQLSKDQALKFKGTFKKFKKICKTLDQVDDRFSGRLESMNLEIESLLKESNQFTKKKSSKKVPHSSRKGSIFKKGRRKSHRVKKENLPFLSNSFVY